MRLILTTPKEAKQVGPELGQMADKFMPRLQKTMEVQMEVLDTGFKSRRLSGRPGLREGRGKLKRSFRWSVTQVGNNMIQAREYSDYPDPRIPWIHETGGTIRPKKAKALAVPIFGTTGKPGDYPNLTLIPRKGKPPLLVEKRMAEWKPKFVLVKQVRIPARLHFFEEMRSGQPRMEAAIDDTIVMGFRKGTV